MPDSNGRTGRAPVLLVLVVLLVFTAFGLLVTALVTNRPNLAWGSVAASVLAGALLVIDWLTRRKSAGTLSEQPAAGVVDTKTPGESDTPATPTVERTEPPLRRSGPTEPESAIMDDSADQSLAQSSSHSSAHSAGRLEDAQPDRDTEPGIEDTDAADAIEVADLEVEVVVIDERPRYHLAGCVWVGERPTIALPLREARDLGFTPCAACTPDGTLAARSRLARQQG